MLLLNVPTKSETRQKLYFKKYKYRITFYLYGARYTDYRKNIQDFTSPTTGLVFDSQHLAKIQSLLDFRAKYSKSNQQTKNDVSIFTTYGDSVRVFCNELSVVSEVVDFNASGYEFTKVNLIDAPLGIKLFVNAPKFKYRVYLKTKRVEDEWKTDFLNFLNNQSGLNPCPALIKFLKDKRNHYQSRYTSSSHFIEYDDDTNRMLLLLFAGTKYIGRQFELKQRP